MTNRVFLSSLKQGRRLATLLGKAYSFISEPALPYALGFFRIGVSLVAILQVGLLWPYLLQLYGNFGFIQWAVIETGTDIWLPSIGKLSMALKPYGLSSRACVYGVFGLYLLSLAGLLVGWKARAFAVSAWLLHSLTVNTGYISLYGVDTMIHICLFYCVWMPVGDALSVPHWRRGRAVVPSFMARLSLRTLQLHLCIIYVSTGIAKIKGEQWRSGEAIWRALMQPQFAVFDMSWLAAVPLIAKAACGGVVTLELGYAFLIWPSKPRPIWLSAIIALHVSIGIMMGLWMFSAMMIIMNCTAFAVDLLVKARSSHAGRASLERQVGALPESVEQPAFTRAS